jgi:hypothetical protein
MEMRNARSLPMKILYQEYVQIQIVFPHVYTLDLFLDLFYMCQSALFKEN